MATPTLKKVPSIALLLLLFILPTAGAKELAPPTGELFQATRKILKGRGDYLEHTVKRLGKKTLGMESYLSSDGDYTMAKRILADLSRYPTWLLPNINNRPSGGFYFLKILNLVVTDRDLATFTFVLNLPLLNQEGKRAFRVTSREEDGSFVVTAQSIPQTDGMIESAIGELHVFPAEGEANRIWLYVKGTTVIRPVLVYEALPERLMGRESGERLKLIARNYLKEEDRVREPIPNKKLK